MAQVKITREMIQYAANNNWCVGHAARHLGFHRKSITQAAEKYGIELLSHKFSAAYSKADGDAWRVMNVKPKKKPLKLSASKDAIARALAKIDAEKKMRAAAE